MDKELKFKVGDKVRISVIKKHNNSYFKVGDEEEVKGILIKHTELIREDKTIHNYNVYYLLKYNISAYSNKFRASQIEKIEEK